MTMLLFDRLTCKEIVIVASEAVGPAGDVRQQRAVVAQQSQARGHRLPVGQLEGQIHALEALADVVGAESRPLQVLPVDLEFLPAFVDAVAEPPEVAVFPGRIGRDAPSAKGPPVVGRISAEHFVPIVEQPGTEFVGIIPAEPGLMIAEPGGFPAQVGPFHFADAEGAVAEKLRVPLGEASFPRHLGAAERSLAVVPPAVHGPVPGERRSVLAQKHRFLASSGPVLKPVGEFLNGCEVRVEVARVHRAEITRGMVVHDP
jgi:hypothetical protein